jgi:hypothetical protein
MATWPVSATMRNTGQGGGCGDRHGVGRLLPASLGSIPPTSTNHSATVLYANSIFSDRPGLRYSTGNHVKHKHGRRSYA